MMKIVKLVKDAKKAWIAKNAPFVVTVFALDSGMKSKNPVTATPNKILSNHYAWNVKDALEWLDAQLVEDAALLTHRHGNGQSKYLKFSGSVDLVKLGK